MVKGDEDKLSNKLVKFLKKALSSELKKYKLELEEKVKVPKDFTFVPNTNKFCFGGARVDIGIFKRTDNSLNTPLIYETRLGEKINIPFIILELKSGNITSDAIRARDLVARHIKSIFPFISYIFIGENTEKKEETLLRQGKNFNNFYC